MCPCSTSQEHTSPGSDTARVQTCTYLQTASDGNDYPRLARTVRQATLAPSGELPVYNPLLWAKLQLAHNMRSFSFSGINGW